MVAGDDGQMRRVRVGFAGVGHWARTAHLPAVAAHPDAEIVALADPDAANLERSRRRYSVEAVFPDALRMKHAKEGALLRADLRGPAE